MDVKRERISHTLELIEISLPFHIALSFVSLLVICSVLDRMFGLEASSVIHAPKYLKLLTLELCLISVTMLLLFNTNLFCSFPQKHVVLVK